MRRVIMADRSRTYLQALAERALSDGIRAEFELYTEVDTLRERMLSAPYHCLFADEHMTERLPALPAERVTRLVGEREEAGPDAIFKFQPACELMRLIKDRINLPALNETCVNVLIAAPEEHPGAELFASFLARRLSENGSVLYLNTDGFSPGFWPETGGEAASLSEILYRQAGGAADGRPAGGKLHGVTYFAPPLFPEEDGMLRSLPLFETAGTLFPKEFRCVVLRHSLGFADACRLIPEADVTYFVKEDGPLGERAAAERTRILEGKLPEETFRRIHQVRLPEARPEGFTAAAYERLWEHEWKEFVWNRAREIW